MKQLTMTKVLTPLAALAFAFGVQAANPGAPEGFESYTAGTTVITNQTGWSFTFQPPAGTFPLSKSAVRKLYHKSAEKFFNIFFTNPLRVEGKLC
jgi:hypothetical protein